MTLTEWLCAVLVRVYQRAKGRLKDVRKASLPDVYGTSGCWPECEMFLVRLLRTVVSNLTWTKKGQIVSRTDRGGAGQIFNPCLPENLKKERRKGWTHIFVRLCMSIYNKTNKNHVEVSCGVTIYLFLLFFLLRR